MSWLGDFISGLIQAGGSYYINQQGAEAQSDAANQAAAYQLAAAREAAAAQTRAAEIAANTQLQMYNSTVARSEPFRQASLAALPKQMYYAGVPGSGYAPNLSSMDPRIQQLQQLAAAAYPSAGGSGGDQSIYAQGLPSAGGSTTATGALPAPGLEGIGGGNVSSPDGMAGLMTVLSALPPGTLDLVLDKLGVGSLEEAIGQGAQKIGEALGVVDPEAASSLGNTYTGYGEEAVSAGVDALSTGAFAAAEAAAYDAAIAAGLSEQGALLAAQNAGLMGTEAAVSNAAALMAGEGATAAGAFGIEGLGMQAAGMTGANLALGGAVLGLPFLAKALFANEKDRSQIYGNYENGAYVGNGNLQPGKQFVSEREQFLDPVAQQLYDAGYTGPLYLSYQPHSDPNKPGYYRYADPSTYTSNVNPYETYNDYGAEGEDRLSNYRRASRGARSQYVMGDKGTKDGSFRDPDAFVKWYVENVPLPDGTVAQVPVSSASTQGGLSDLGVSKFDAQGNTQYAGLTYDGDPRTQDMIDRGIFTAKGPLSRESVLSGMSAAAPTEPVVSAPAPAPTPAPTETRSLYPYYWDPDQRY